MRVLLICQSCRYLIDDHKERRKFLHVAHISAFMYELDLMTFVLKSIFRQFLLRPTLSIIIHDVYDNNYFGHYYILVLRLF